MRGGRGSGSRGRGGTRGAGGRTNSREQRVARERQRREEDANVAPNANAVEDIDEGYVDPVYERIVRLGRLRLGELRADTDDDNNVCHTGSVVDGVFDRIARMQQQEDTTWRRRP